LGPIWHAERGIWSPYFAVMHGILFSLVVQDPACTSYSGALLFYKGYHAIQTHRIAHVLLGRGQKLLAKALQSRMSEVLAVDIHPAARIGGIRV
jgi:serine acetyltransferase